MLRNISSFFQRHDLNDRESRQTFRVLNTVVLVNLLGALGTLIAVFTFDATIFARFIVIGMNVLLLISFILLRQRILLPARFIAPLSLFITVLFLVITGSGIHDISLIAFGGIIVLASLTLGRRAAFVYGGLTIVAIFAVAFAEMNQILVRDASFLTTIDDPFLISIVVIGITITQVALIDRLNNSIKDVRANEEAHIQSNKELLEIRDSLEARIQERTADLTAATMDSQRRARQFEAIARVSGEISSARELETLLPRITQAISEQFGFYHVGIFFNDPDNQFATLEAANSEGGQRMLKREHKLRIGAQGIVGYVTGTGLPRVAQNVGDDSVYFTNPDLPNTLTEMALPLKINGLTVGALDVQSTEAYAITNEDIASLSILADQVSIAIENARLYESTRKSLEHTESAYRQYVQSEWARFTREERIAGYHFLNGASHPLELPQDLGDASRAVKEGKIHQVEAGESDTPAQLAVPVRMRGKVVGILHISQPKKSRWTDDDIDIAEAVAERLALSIENARLFQVTAARAARERIVSDFSSRISGNIRIDNILRTAAQELSQALNGSEVMIQLMKRESATEVQE